MYKLIAVDMDGTLLNEDKHISDRTITAVTALKAMGKKVVLATGRPYNGIRRYIEQLDLLDDSDFVVTYNGALVQSTVDSRVLLNRPLSVADYRDLYPLSQSLGVNIHALTANTVLTPKHNPYTDIEASINHIEAIEMPVNEVAEDTLIVKVMFVDAPEKLDAILPQLPEWVKQRYTILRSAPIFLEFLDPGVDKGVGVHAVAEALGLTKDQVICVGDAHNDLAMIEYAKLGVAMGNAIEELKAAADYVTLTNEDDGVAHVIEKFML